MSEMVLSVNGVAKHFGGVIALKNVNLALGKHEILGLIGPNGSGKTTLVNMISGFLKPTKGDFVANGKPIAGLPPHRVAHSGVTRTFQNLRVFRRRTVLENVMVGQITRVSGLELFLPFATARRDMRYEQAMGLLDRFGLADKADNIAGALSFGDQKRLELARAMACKPDILLLDEPAGGMNPSEIEELKATLREMRDEGLSILLIEHNMRLVMSVCDRIAVLCFGEIIMDGKPEDVRVHPEVIRSYLGHGGA